jgi:hypothetical protein
MGPSPSIEQHVPREVSELTSRTIEVAGLSHLNGDLLRTKTRARTGDIALSIAGQRLYAPAAAPVARVLQISQDLTLSQSREMILRSVGCPTITVPARAVIADRDLEPFDVALLCQSVCTPDALSIAAGLRLSAPHIMIFRIVLLPEDAEGHFDAILPAPVEPSVLQLQVCRLARQAHMRAAISSTAA